VIDVAANSYRSSVYPFADGSVGSIQLPFQLEVGCTSPAGNLACAVGVSTLDRKGRSLRNLFDMAHVRVALEDLFGEDLPLARVRSIANGVVGILGAKVVSITAIGRRHRAQSLETSGRSK